MLNENNIVEKSKAIVWAKFQDYGSGELKILDTYLSRINARDPDSSMVTFTKKEYAELMGIDPDVRTSQLKAYTRGLLGNVVTIDLPGEGYVQYPLFSEAKCFLDKKLGQTVIQIECNTKLKQIFFDLADNGYVRYQLKNVIALRGQYSIRLYAILKDRPFGWTVGVDELRELIGATSSTYDTFKRFNSMVLKKALDEINTITDITVTVDNIRRGRFVTSLRFTVKSKAVLVQSTPDDIDPDDKLAIYIEALPTELTREQVDLLRGLAFKHVDFDPFGPLPIECVVANYLREKTALMYAQTKPVATQARFAWLRRAVDEDWK